MVLIVFALLGFGVGAGGAFAREHDFPARFWLYLEARDNGEKSPEPPPQQKAAVSVPILVYHSIRPLTGTDSEQLRRYSVEPIVFERQLQYLKDRGYTVMSSDVLIDYVSRSAIAPEKPVVLTLDDGWENQYTYAFPLLKKYSMPATFFIFTNAIGRKHFLTWEQVGELVSSGMEIGGHTQSHPYLIKISDPKKLVAEIAGGKKIIESHIGRGITIFAYPFGQYDDAAVAAVKGAGYKAARTTRRGMIQNRDDPYTLRAIQVQNSMESLISALHGL